MILIGREKKKTSVGKEVEAQRPVAIIQERGSNYAQFLDICWHVIEVKFTYDVVHRYDL